MVTFRNIPAAEIKFIAPVNLRSQYAIIFTYGDYTITSAIERATQTCIGLAV